MSRTAVLWVTAAISLSAQPICPPVNFLVPRTVNLVPSATSHIDVVRQSDGSYTGFEVANAAPHRTLSVTPHFEQQFTACLPHKIPSSPAKAPVIANPPGAQSQLQAEEQISSGNYFVATISDLNTIDFDIFDGQHNLISETPFTSVVAPGTGGIDNDHDQFLSLALADLNGDGILDLIAVFVAPVAASGWSGGVWTFLGNGAGTFQAGNRQVLTQRPPNEGAPAQAVAVGDFNGDGKPDLVVTGPLESLLVIALGNGDGTFNPQTLPVFSPSETQYSGPVAAADLNGDGKLDLVLSTIGTPNVDSSVAVMLGNGDATFEAAVLYGALPQPSSVAIGDLNGDGIPDIATNGGTILFGDGKGGFPSLEFYPSNATGSVMIADFDGDGLADIILGNGNPTFLSGNGSANPYFANAITAPTATVLFGAGGGTFVGPVSNVLSANCSAFVTADFNRDGSPDIALVGTTDSNVFITTLLGQGNGQFSKLATQTLTSSINFFILGALTADFNHDGKPDIAIFGDTEAQIYLGHGDGTFSAASTLSISSGDILSAAAPDLNGDGIPDLVITTDGSILVWLGNGDGTFRGPVFTTTGSSPAVAFGDFNGDGKLDMAAANYGSMSLSVYLGNGDGTFSNAMTSALPAVGSGGSRNLFGPFAQTIAVADFNGDGHLDVALLLGTLIFQSPSPDWEVAILLGKGDGTFSVANVIPGNLLPIQVADINGDKIPDLIGNQTAGLSVLLGNGDGTFQPPEIVVPPAMAFVIADFDRNGTPDVAQLNEFQFPPTLSVLLNLSQPPPPLTVVSGASFAPNALTPDSIASAFGENLASMTAAATLSLPTTLSGITINVRDSSGVTRPAPLFFVSRNQVNFLIPVSTAVGAATVTVNGTLSGKPVTAQAQIASVAPALFTVGSDIAAAYAVQVTPAETETTYPVFMVQLGNIVPAPINLAQPGQVYLTLYGTGFDSATATSTMATVQGVNVPVTYSGPQSTFAGLDQINLSLPPSLAGTGLAAISVTIAGQTSNTVYVNIQ